MANGPTRFTCACRWSVAASEAAYPALEMKNHLVEAHGVADPDLSSIWESWVTATADIPAPHRETTLESTLPPSRSTAAYEDLAPDPLAVVMVVCRARRKALAWFAIGVATFALGSLSAIAASNSDTGGVIWTGGMLVGAIMFWRSFQLYRAVRPVGVPTTWGGRAVVATGAAACLALGIGALNATGTPAPVPPATDAGSCWTDTGGGHVSAVPCESEHDYRVTSVVSDSSLCPQGSQSYVELSPLWLGCLVDD